MWQLLSKALLGSTIQESTWTLKSGGTKGPHRKFIYRYPHPFQLKVSLILKVFHSQLMFLALVLFLFRMVDGLYTGKVGRRCYAQVGDTKLAPEREGKDSMAYTPTGQLDGDAQLALKREGKDSKVHRNSSFWSMAVKQTGQVDRRSADQTSGLLIK